MGDCQNYGPYYSTAPNLQGTQKGTIILTTTHVGFWGGPIKGYATNFVQGSFRLHELPRTMDRGKLYTPRPPKCDVAEPQKRAWVFSFQVLHYPFKPYTPS